MEVFRKKFYTLHKNSQSNILEIQSDQWVHGLHVIIWIAGVVKIDGLPFVADIWFFLLNNLPMGRR